MPDITRRGSLTASGLGAGGLFPAGDVTSNASPVGLVDDLLDPLLGTFTRRVIRREDFLAVTFDFRNLRLDNANPRRLVKNSAAQPAFLIVHFAPQHLADEAFIADQNLPAPGAVRARLAEPTRLAFLVPNSALPLPFNLDALLDWMPLGPRLVPAAAQPPQVPAAAAPIRAPEATETSIELPWFLILSPQPLGGWAHATAPVTHDGRTELWHTRLGTRTAGGVVEDGPAKPLVQAVWNRDRTTPFADPAGAPHFSLTADDRRQLVEQTSNRSRPARRPVVVDRLMLSALGGWLDVRGDWPEPDPIATWRHRATMGRDSYVRVVPRGFLFPFGHRAVSTTITERRFTTGPGGNQRAYLHKRQFVIVRRPVRDYGALGHPDHGRAFPYRSVRITTVTTPDIKFNFDPVYVPTVIATGEPVLFDIVGVDWAGRETELDMPLTFVSAEQTQVKLNSMIIGFNATDPDGAGAKPRRRAMVRGQAIAFAPEDQPGDTTFEVTDLVLAAQPALDGALAQLRAAGEATFFPLLQDAGLRLQAAEQLAGQALDTVRMTLDSTFIETGFDEAANAGLVFLKTVGAGPVLSFVEAADKAGGLATPELGISAITRAAGPVGGVIDDLRKGTFDPATYLSGAAKLLGATRLLDVLAHVTAADGGATAGPRIQTVLEPKPDEGLPQRAITVLDWTPKLKTSSIVKVDGDSSLTLNVRVVTEFADPELSTFTARGDLRNVDLSLIGDDPFLILGLKKIAFLVVPDKKPDFDVEIGDVTFAGVLQFVEEFKNFLSSLGKGYGIDVTPAGIEASLSLPLPRVAVGVFTMQNLSIGVGAIIPFNGDAARFRFNFCTRENPFILSISMFGGGGFFEIECGTDKSVWLALGFEFGASVAFDIGVASGGVEVMAGIYIEVMELPPAPTNASLTGYVRLGGQLSVLGIISISLELYLGFTYVFPPVDKCIGRARFRIEVEILIFSFSFEREIERRFGGEADPTFAQLMAPTDWAAYADAYAELGAP